MHNLLSCPIRRRLCATISIVLLLGPSSVIASTPDLNQVTLVGAGPTWASSHDGGGNSFNAARGIETSADGSRVFATGWVNVPPCVWYGNVHACTDWAASTAAYDSATGQEIWRSKYGGGYIDSGLAIVDNPQRGIVVTAGRVNKWAQLTACPQVWNSGWFVAAYDRASGVSQWTREMWFTPPPSCSPRLSEASGLAVSDDGEVLVVSGPADNGMQRIFALDSSTGSTLWSVAEQGSQVGTPLVRSDLWSALLPSGCSWTSYDLRAGEVNWRASAPFGSCKASLGKGDLVSLAGPSESGMSVTAIHVATGATVWEAEVPRPTDSQACITNYPLEPWVSGSADRLLVAHTCSQLTSVASLDTADGRVLWETPVLFSSPKNLYFPVNLLADAASGTVFLVGGTSNVGPPGGITKGYYHTAFDMDTGERIWSGAHFGPSSQERPWAATLLHGAGIPTLFVAGGGGGSAYGPPLPYWEVTRFDVDSRNVAVFADMRSTKQEIHAGHSFLPWAHDPTRPPLFFALGDSVVSGHGIKPYYPAGGSSQLTSVKCKRSDEGFAYRLSQLLSNEGLVDPWPDNGYGTAKNAPCTGFTSKQIANTAFALPNVESWIRNSGRDALVLVNGGMNDFDFGSGSTGRHVFCDSKQDFELWVRGVTAGIIAPFVGTGDSQTFDKSILGRLLDAGNTTVVVTGYYNPIEQNLSHPLLLWWRSSSPSWCSLSLGTALDRAAWANDQLNRALQASVDFANTQRLGAGRDRARFVQPATAFLSHVSCDGNGFVQKHVIVSDPIDGDDCIHPNRAGANVLANIAYVGFRQDFTKCPLGIPDSPAISCGKYRVTGDPVPLNE